MDAPPVLPPAQVVDLDGVAVATWALQPQGADPVGDLVLCHGTPWSARVWWPVATQLAQTYRVLLWDMPGYGQSIAGPGVPVDLATQQRRFAELMEVWGVRAPRVVAHDIGGAVALGGHLRHDVEFADLTLCDIVTLDPWGSPFFRLVAEQTHVFERLPPRLHRALVREYIAGAAGPAVSPAWLDALTQPWEGEGQSAFYRQIAQLSPEHTRPLVDLLDQVRCPVQVLWGADDPWIPVEQADGLAGRIPLARAPVVVPNAGHLAPLEASEQILRLLA